MHYDSHGNEESSQHFQNMKCDVLHWIHTSQLLHDFSVNETDSLDRTSFLSWKREN